ncbi:CLUMA_CG019958, isoform A [Clunio marinus]|uniref:CLUMA_CG019958, isoform A n=1 Tax=Clunio marinus TaxID=568069 RepID=A0A1J1J3L1_9DIPT|nr:CLUMA_CG019958, isoform A [Clunio marinus]
MKEKILTSATLIEVLAMNVDRLYRKKRVKKLNLIDLFDVFIGNHYSYAAALNNSQNNLW